MQSVLIPSSSDLEQLTDPSRRILLACERAKTWLAQALEAGQIEQIIELKSQAEAIRIYTMQKQLGKDAELSAAEIVRRAERCMALAIEKGRESGELLKHGQTKSKMSSTTTSPKAVTDLIGRDEFYGSGEHPGVRHLADGVSDEGFEKAIEKAKADRNLSRANVVRKIKGKKGNGGIDWGRLDSLAAEGHTSRQIAEKLGVHVETVAKRAKERGVTIQADKVVRGSRRIDPNRVLGEFVATLESLAPSCELIEPSKVDRKVLKESIRGMNEAMKAFNSLRRLLRRAMENGS